MTAGEGEAAGDDRGPFGLENGEVCRIGAAAAAAKVCCKRRGGFVRCRRRFRESSGREGDWRPSQKYKTGNQRNTQTAHNTRKPAGRCNADRERGHGRGGRGVKNEMPPATEQP